MIELIKYNRSGFTLIEITIALLILAVGLVGILTLFPVGFDASGRAAHITEATFLAQGLIEDLKREGYDGATVVAAIVPKATPVPVVSGDFEPDYPNYEYDILTFDDADTGVTGLREVIVRVYWPAVPGASQGDRATQRSVELITYIADYGS